MMKRLGVLFFIGVCIGIAPNAAVAADFQVPGTNTSLDVGGYIKLDAIYNDVSSGDNTQSNVEYNPSGIPLDGQTVGEKNEFIFTARESRMWVKTSTPTDLGPLKTHLEFDFDSTNSGDSMSGNQVVSNSEYARIRHAYGELNNLLFGQTWSLWMHLESLPEINDFGGPTGSMFVRQPQIRYTMTLNDTSILAFGLENPETYYFNNDGAAADDDFLPDIIVRYSVNPVWGNLSAAIMVRQLMVDEPANNIDDSTFTAAGQVGAVVELGAYDTVKGALSFGDGIGRYSSLASHFDAVVTSGGSVNSVSQIAGFAGYEHIWGGAKNWRSNLILGYSKADDPSELANTDKTEQTLSLHANVFMDPVQGARLGLEYIHGERETYNGKDGDLNRLQFSAMFVF